ncbi:MAG: ATP-binding cassette domain-containing protein, partial [Betaproteobacteria bacterium]|nr:ATP-binding cassette domain-containing protein [Betaproteobacteria bacterium]
MEPRDITRLGVARSFQIPQLFDQLTVDENLEVAEIIARHASTASQTKELSRVRALALERFGLVPQRDQLAKTLPGGARKLLDIAMAVVSHPSVLVLDEPTSGV